MHVMTLPTPDSAVDSPPASAWDWDTLLVSFYVGVIAVWGLLLSAAAGGQNGFNVALSIEGTALGLWGVWLAVGSARSGEVVAVSADRLEALAERTNARIDLNRLDEVAGSLLPLRFPARGGATPGPSAWGNTTDWKSVADRFPELHAAVLSAAAIDLPNCQALVAALVPDSDLREILGAHDVDLDRVIDAAYDEIHTARVVRQMRLQGVRSQVQRAQEPPPDGCERDDYPLEERRAEKPTAT